LARRFENQQIELFLLGHQKPSIIGMPNFLNPPTRPKGKKTKRNIFGAWLIPFKRDD